MNDTQNETASPKARSSEQARAAVQARWLRAKGVVQEGTVVAPEVEPEPLVDPLGIVRDRNGKVITDPGMANIIRNIWAYGPPYCPEAV